MKKLGEAARDLYSSGREPILTEGMRVDRAVGEGDRIENRKRPIFLRT